jgi:hypothetical protein
VGGEEGGGELVVEDGKGRGFRLHPAVFFPFLYFLFVTGFLVFLLSAAAS